MIILPTHTEQNKPVESTDNDKCVKEL